MCASRRRAVLVPQPHTSRVGQTQMRLASPPPPEHQVATRIVHDDGSDEPDVEAVLVTARRGGQQQPGSKRRRNNVRSSAPGEEEAPAAKKRVRVRKGASASSPIAIADDGQCSLRSMGGATTCMASIIVGPGAKKGPPGASLDIAKIMQGYAPGRELGAAKEKVQTLTGFDQDELRAKIECAEAACVWNPSTLTKASSTALQSAWQTLHTEGHVLPQSSMLVFTRRFAEEASSEMNLAAWVGVVWPVSRPSTADASVWTATSPSFAALTPPTGSADEEEEAGTQAFGRSWEESAITNHVATLVTNIDDPNSRKNLLKLCEAFLDKYTSEGSTSHVPKCMSDIVRSVVALFRGFVTLLDPTPGRYGATAADVAFVVPQRLGKDGDKEKHTLECSLTRGKALSRIISRSSQWKTLLDDFYRFSGGAAEHSSTLDDMSGAITQLVNSLRPSVESASLEDRKACMSAILGHLVTLRDTRARLRSGATQAFEGFLVEQVTPFWKFLDRRSNAELPLLVKIDEVMRHVDVTVVPSANSMQLEVNELLLVWQHEEKASGLSKAASVSMSCPQHRQALEQQLKASKNITKPSDLIGKFKQSFAGVLSAMKDAAIACNLQNMLVSDMQAEFDTGISLLDLLAAEIGAAHQKDSAGRDAKFISDLIRQYTAWVCSFEKIGSGVLLQVVREHERMMHIVSEGSSPFEQCSMEAKAFVNAVFHHISNVLAPLAREKIEPVAHSTMSQHLVVMNKAAADLKPRAGGGSSPHTNWWDGYHESGKPILTWFVETLDKIDTAGIEAKITKLEQALARFSPDVVWYRQKRHTGTRYVAYQIAQALLRIAICEVR